MQACISLLHAWAADLPAVTSAGIGDEEEGQQAKGSSGGNVTVLLTTFIMLGDCPWATCNLLESTPRWSCS